MFEVRNRHNETLYRNENLQLAKIQAEYLHDGNKKYHYDVYEVKQVWTTQTLDEAIK